jgi:hypothetical protein
MVVHGGLLGGVRWEIVGVPYDMISGVGVRWDFSWVVLIVGGVWDEVWSWLGEASCQMFSASPPGNDNQHPF